MCWKMVNYCFGLTETELPLQVKELEYLRVLFTSEHKMERDIDRLIGAESAVKRNDAAVTQDCLGKDRASRKVKFPKCHLLYVLTLICGHELCNDLNQERMDTKG